jgi:serine/threonine protein phosphatase 1
LGLNLNIELEPKDYERNTNRASQYVISDIHGCYFTLTKLLNKIGPSEEDEIYFLGDYIDRGPASKEVIDYLIDLKESGYNLHAIK